MEKVLQDFLCVFDNKSASIFYEESLSKPNDKDFYKKYFETKNTSAEFCLKISFEQIPSALISVLNKVLSPSK